MNDDDYRILAFRLKVLSALALRLMRQDMDKELKRKGIKISPLSIGVLRLLKHQERTLGELSDHMIIAAATLVPVVDALCEKGYVKRVNDVNDRRRSTLTITPKADALLKKAPLISDDDELKNHLVKMGPAKSRELVLLTEELVANISGNSSICSKIEGVARQESEYYKKGR